MTIGHFTELVVEYDPAKVHQRLAQRRRMVRSRLWSLGITAVILVVLYVWQRDQLRGTGFVAGYAIVAGLALIWLAIALILYVRARRELAGLAVGVAIRMGPPGVQVGALGLGWPAVASLRTVRAGLGRAAHLRLVALDGQTGEVSLDHVVVFPATLDSSARAFSAGRHGVDLSALDN